jgi:hypothetical protein
MPSRITDAVPCTQTVRAAATPLRDEIDNRIYPFGRHQFPVMPRMARLTAGLAATLPATSTLALAAREAIR